MRIGPGNIEHLKELGELKLLDITNSKLNESDMSVIGAMKSLDRGTCLLCLTDLGEL